MINSERELLDMAIALREENRALKALLKQVIRDVKMTVEIPVLPKLGTVVTKTSYDVCLQRETVFKLIKLEGK